MSGSLPQQAEVVGKSQGSGLRGSGLDLSGYHMVLCRECVYK
jgi:hypothetical protein